jgi:DNA invertase Pin-like site-specific DNA recombinase
MATCRAWAVKNDAEIGGPFEDDTTGAAPLDRRPGLMAAIGELRKGDVLLVAKRDRIARDPIVTAMVESAAKRKGARLVSATGEGTDNDDPTSILMRRIVDAFAEYERLIIKGRTKAALQAKIRRGERCGKIRFGFRLAADGRTLEPIEAEQEAIRTIRELHSRGESLRKIAAELSRRGILTKEGKTTWEHTTIRGISSRSAIAA